MRARGGDLTCGSRDQHRLQQGGAAKQVPAQDSARRRGSPSGRWASTLQYWRRASTSRKGELDASPNIRRTSWWSDGAAPGAKSGTVLIAGHADSANLGPGAFYRLKEARVGDRVTVTSRSGARRTYRVVSVRTMPKAQLPPDVYSTRAIASPSSRAVGRSSRPRALPRQRRRHRRSCLTLTTRRAEGASLRGRRHRSRSLRRRGDRCRAEA